ncbi:WbqC family protein [Legionella sp. WA2024007413]
MRIFLLHYFELDIMDDLDLKTKARLSKKIAILQSNYIPWKGYFDMIAAVDELILFDDMQFTRRDWRNRNQIKTSQGLQWLTVPVKVKGKYFQSIRETEIDGEDWAQNHWKTLTQNYRRAPYFDEIAAWLEPLYLNNSYTHLSVLNHQFIKTICHYLGIKTAIKNSWDYILVEGKTERLANLCLQAEAAEYISGPAAMDYIEEDVFTAHDIKLTWFDYTGYEEYPQLWGEFIHQVSILDLLFNCGNNSSTYMKYLNT